MRFFNRLALILQMIKFEHTLFALPFAYLGAILGSKEMLGVLPSWGQLGWVTMAMFGARSAAMALNRVIDRHIDAKNARTEGRAIPMQAISLPFAWVFIVISLLIFGIAASQLNLLAMQLLPLAIFCLVIYSYTKRFTWLCHFVLGIAIGLAPLGGWVATTGQINGLGVLLFITVAFWIAGFDIIYACQDMQFDQQEGLYSIPVRFGLAKALLISSLTHAFTLAGLVGLLMYSHLSLWFAVGIVIATMILIYEHAIVSPTDLSRLNTAFFTMNGVLSVVIFLFAMVDVWYGR